MAQSIAVESAPKRRTPWRDNVEALTVAIIMAVVLKYFVVEAYKIPTGSMQPTLMGQQWEGGGIFDRILVDKLSYHYRDPERFEIVVFKYPLDRAKNFVKRLVGMPGEQLRIRDGDVWTRADSSEPWQILRRPRPVQEATWKRLDSVDEEAGWKAEGEPAGDWTFGRREVGARGPGRVKFRGHGGGAILDSYSHGYDPKIAAKLPPKGISGQNPVGDLRIAGEVRAGADCPSVTLELDEGGRRYQFEIPGPAAPEGARPTVRVEVRSGNETFPDDQRGDVRADEPYRLPEGTWVSFGAQNLDDLLELDIDGEVIAALEVPPAGGDQRSAAYVSSAGGNADFRDLEVYRDIYYLESAKFDSTWTIPEGHYFMLGDNTQDSSDSREWSYWNLRWQGERSNGELVRGNNRKAPFPGRYAADSNPIRHATFGPHMTWFRDEWGELFVFPTESELPVRPQEQIEPAPFVPRNLITGRALLVFWPLKPFDGIYRFKWTR